MIYSKRNERRYYNRNGLFLQVGSLKLKVYGVPWKNLELSFSINGGISCTHF